MELWVGEGEFGGCDFESGNVKYSNLKPRCPHMQLGIDPAAKFVSTANITT